MLEMNVERTPYFLAHSTAVRTQQTARNTAFTRLLAPHGKARSTRHYSNTGRIGCPLDNGGYHRRRVEHAVIAQRKDPLCGSMRAGLSYPVRMRIKDRLPAPQRTGTSITANIKRYKHLEQIDS
jgi:hypothetical protein